VGATCKITKQEVAIKHIKDFSLYDYDCCKLIREIQITIGLEEVSKNKKSCFFPQLLDIIVPADTNSSSLNDIFLVLEKEDSDLRQFMKSGGNLSFGGQHVKTVLYNLLCAAKFIGSANVIHRDLKPANILINRFCQVKFCDFGLSRTLPEALANRQKMSSGETTCDTRPKKVKK
jgi:mitogen-activated protein kinase 1/3